MTREICNPLARFFKYVTVEPDSDCIFWIGNTNHKGYGLFSVRQTHPGAHRWLYEYTNEKIPLGMVLDHECKNRNCVNPNHLRVVTPRENVLYNSDSIQATNLRKTVCVNGHGFTEANTRIRKRLGGGRRCIECDKINARKSWMAELRKRADNVG